jgi:hypothetical protein
MRTFASISVLLAAALLATAASGHANAGKAVAEPGSYSGTASGYPVSFFVAPGGRSLINIAMPGTVLGCTPGGGSTSDRTFSIARVALRPDGSFSGRGSQRGVFAVAAGAAATFTYSFSGRFQRATKQHAATAAGTFREDVRYTDSAGAHLLCTTNRQSWTAARSGPLAAAKTLVVPGNYTGTGGGGYPLSFTSLAGKTAVATVTIPGTVLACTGAGSTSDRTFAIARVVVGRDGSFSGKASQTGVLGAFQGASATFSYTFSGNFQGRNADGVGSAAGTFREDVAVTDASGVHRLCTTNTQLWSATRSS